MPIRLSRTKELSRPEYEDDVITLQKQLREKGYIASLHDISYAWQAFSDGMCAGWMCLGDAHENIENILPYFDTQEEVYIDGSE